MVPEKEERKVILRLCFDDFLVAKPQILQRHIHSYLSFSVRMYMFTYYPPPPSPLHMNPNTFANFSAPFFFLAQKTLRIGSFFFNVCLTLGDHKSFSVKRRNFFPCAKYKITYTLSLRDYFCLFRPYSIVDEWFSHFALLILVKLIRIMRGWRFKHWKVFY